MTTGAAIEATTPTTCAGPHDAPLSIQATQNSATVPRTWPSRLAECAACATIAAAAKAPMIDSLRMIGACAEGGTPAIATASATAAPPATAITAVDIGVHRRRERRTGALPAAGSRSVIEPDLIAA